MNDSNERTDSSPVGVPGAFLANVQHLKRLDGARLLTALPAFAERLREEPHLRVISEGLMRELDIRIGRFAAHDQASIELRRER